MLRKENVDKFLFNLKEIVLEKEEDQKWQQLGIKCTK